MESAANEVFIYAQSFQISFDSSVDKFFILLARVAEEGLSLALEA